MLHWETCCTVRVLHRMGVAPSGCHTSRGAVPVPIPIIGTRLRPPHPRHWRPRGPTEPLPGHRAAAPSAPLHTNTGERAGLQPWAGTHTAHRTTTLVNIIIIISVLKGEPAVPSLRTSPQSPLGQPGSWMDGWQSRGRAAGSPPAPPAQPPALAAAREGAPQPPNACASRPS